MKNTSKCEGFTLVELVVVVAIFMVVIIISTYAFENILKKSGQQGKAAESEIAGLVGLEMMRADIATAGYGLPWAFPSGITPNYSTEVTSSPVSGFEVNATSFNDDPSVNSANVPRAIVSGTGASGIDYMVVKGTALGMNDSSRRWNYVNYSSGNNSYLKLKNDPSTDLQSGDRAISIVQTFTPSGGETKQLAVTGSGNYYYSVPTGTPPKFTTSLAAFQPFDRSQIFVAYGIAESTVTPRMPYNRIDFYVDKAVLKPVSCNPGTGALFKAVADHAGGFRTPYPLLDCVGDMQVSYDRDQNNDGNITQIDATTIATMSANDIRTQIKNVRVYVLAHEGKMDPNYSYPVSDANNVICVGPYVGTQCSAVGRSWSQSNLEKSSATGGFGPDWKHYRWKVYHFVVNLKNLQ